MIGKEAASMSNNLTETSGSGALGADRHADQAMNHIRQALAGLRFGEVSIIVQDGVVVQVERTERTRLRRSER